MTTSGIQIPEPMLMLIALTLVHFVWQGAILAGILAISLYHLRRSTANARYLCAVSGLVVMALCPIVTGAVLHAHRRLLTPPDSYADARYAASRHIPNRVSWNANAKALSESTNRSDISTPIQRLAAFLQRRANSKGLVLAWLTGVLGLSIRGCGGWLYINRMLRRADAPEPDFQDQLRAIGRLSAMMRISRPPRLRIVYETAGPFVFGAFRAVIVLPASALSGLSGEMLETIIAHELAHVRRHDCLVNMAQVLIETVLFYHPAIWWASQVVRTEREVCCDDLVIATLNNRLTYAGALARLEDLRGHRLTIAARDGTLLYRIKNILEGGSSTMRFDSSGPDRRHLTTGVSAMTLGVCLLAGLQTSFAQQNLSGRGALPAAAAFGVAAHSAPPSSGVKGNDAIGPVEGPGVVIALSDSTRKPAPGHEPNEGLIHDSDLQSLVHELWNSGTAATPIAIAIAIETQRLDKTSTIRALGRDIAVDNIPLPGPYHVRVIGNSAAIRRAVEGHGVLARLVQIDPKMVSITESDSISLPGGSAAPAKVRGSRCEVAMRVVRCDMAADGSVKETVVSSPRAITFAGQAASFSTSSTSGEGQQIVVNPWPVSSHRYRLNLSFAMTDSKLTTLTAHSVPGLEVENNDFVRVVGVLQTNDAVVKRAVESGKLVDGHGAYTAYFVDVKVTSAN